MFTKEFKEVFDSDLHSIDEKKEWGRYVHDISFNMIRSHVPPNSSVLAIGPWVSRHLPSLEPSRAIGVDPFLKISSPSSTENIRFYPNIEPLAEHQETFDYIVLSFSMGMMEDILKSLKYLRRFCTQRTRIISIYYSRGWQPLIKASEIFGIKVKLPEMNWLPMEEVENLLYLSDFQNIKRTKFCLLPFKIPLLSDLVNKYFSVLPFLGYFGFLTLEIGRIINFGEEKNNTPKITVLIPARNEAGHIDEIIRRTPDFPGGTELIFVEGGSTDDTNEKIKTAIKENPALDISLLTQDGKGKKNAVETGFKNATGDIFLILDADMTVPPESLPMFVDALTADKAEFINGSRMVYPMRGKAMRFFNIMGNVFFSRCFSYLLEQKVRDTLCGTKVLYKKDYLQLMENKAYFGDFDPFGDFDLLFGATYLNLKIVDLPVRYEERVYGETNINRWRDGLTLLKMVIIGTIKLKFNWLPIFGTHK